MYLVSLGHRSWDGLRSGAAAWASDLVGGPYREIGVFLLDGSSADAAWHLARYDLLSFNGSLLPSHVAWPADCKHIPLARAPWCLAVTGMLRLTLCAHSKPSQTVLRWVSICRVGEREMRGWGWNLIVIKEVRTWGRKVQVHMVCGFSSRKMTCNKQVAWENWVHVYRYL